MNGDEEGDEDVDPLWELPSQKWADQTRARADQLEGEDASSGSSNTALISYFRHVADELEMRSEAREAESDALEIGAERAHLEELIDLLAWWLERDRSSAWAVLPPSLHLANRAPLVSAAFRDPLLFDLLNAQVADLLDSADEISVSEKALAARILRAGRPAKQSAIGNNFGRDFLVVVVLLVGIGSGYWELPSNSRLTKASPRNYQSGALSGVNHGAFDPPSETRRSVLLADTLRESPRLRGLDNEPLRPDAIRAIWRRRDEIALFAGLSCNEIVNTW